ncbi:transposase [Streptomyces sp. W16]|uniref:transposase n=1 Tax=Streptomyces sp. W16 TaxID=3076631 RepID=UPI00295B0513|nr:transposase [Streptomyces sp. W16]MDV9169314.1 transposase [Streptomyces sp. W16]
MTRCLFHSLARSTWCADQLRDALRAFVVQFSARPDGVLVLDSTTFLKKGRMSAGAADRESYLPASW